MFKVAGRPQNDYKRSQWRKPRNFKFWAPCKMLKICTQATLLLQAIFKVIMT